VARLQVIRSCRNAFATWVFYVQLDPFRPRRVASESKSVEQ
jgi:hypothetical protein